MEDRTNATHKVDIQTKRIEPIFDASGTLRHVPSDTSKPSADEDFQFGRRYGHPAR